MSEKLRAPVEEIRFAWIEFSGFLILTGSLERVRIGSSAAAEGGSILGEFVGGAQNRIRSVAASRGGIGDAGDDKLRLVEIGRGRSLILTVQSDRGASKYYGANQHAILNIMKYRAAMLVLLAGAAGHGQPRGPYPARWWTPVPEDQKASWEVLPQAAKPGQVILSKRNELGILSNFAATPFVFRGQRYASVEGFWQMMLYPEGPDDPRAQAKGMAWPHTRAEVAQMTAFEAKDAGTAAEENMRKMGIDWVTFAGKRMEYRSKTKGEHYRLIVGAMRAKLEQNPKVREILLETGDLVLLPDHIEEVDPPAEWLYFRIWMEIRSELQSHNQRN